MNRPINSLATHTRMSSCLYKRFYVILLLVAILATSIMILLIGSDFISKEKEIRVKKRGTLPCNSSSSIILHLVQCASTPNECILGAFVCDLIPDCSDQSDESNATCRGIPSCNEQVANTCMNNGSCVSYPRTARRVAYHSCKCTDGYKGEHCETLAPTTTEAPSTTLELSTTTEQSTVEVPKTQTLETLKSGTTNTNNIMSTVTDGVHTSLPSSPSTLPQLTPGRLEIVPEATSVLTDKTDGTTRDSEATTTTFLDNSTPVLAPSPTYDASSTATIESTDTTYTNTNIATIVPATARPLSTSTITSASILTTLSLTTNGGKTREPTSDPPDMTSPSILTPQWLSTPDMEEVSTTTSDEPSTSFGGFSDGMATTTTTARPTDVFLQPTSQVLTSPTMMTIQPTTKLQDPLTPNKVSFVCDEVDRALSAVECAQPNECTINIFVCDGVSDCSDGSDESPATCLGEPACDQAPMHVCENGGTCFSNPLTSQRVAHVTCLCGPNYTGETCLQEVDLTTLPSPLSSTLLSSNTTEVSTVEDSPATVSVTQNTEGTQNIVEYLTTEIDSTTISRDIEVSPSLISNPVPRTISDSPATGEPTAGNTEVMSSSTDVSFGNSYTTATEVVTSYATALTTMLPSTTQDLATDTASISDSSGTPVSEIITPLPLTSDTDTQTWTPKSSPTSDRPTITEDVLFVSDMITDHLTTEYDDSRIVTEITTIPVSNIEDNTKANTDIALGLSTEPSALTEVSTQLLSLQTSTVTLPTVEPSQIITDFEKESTKTVTLFDETTEMATTDETQLPTDINKSTSPYVTESIISTSSIYSESVPIKATTLGHLYSSEHILSTGQHSSTMSTATADSITGIRITEITISDTTISEINESPAYSTSTAFGGTGTQSGTIIATVETDYTIDKTTEASNTQSDITIFPGETVYPMVKTTENSSTQRETTISPGETDYPMVKTTENSSTQRETTISPGETDYPMVKTTENSSTQRETTISPGETDYPMVKTTENSSTQRETTISPGETDYPMVKTTEASITQSDRTISTGETEYPMAKTTENTNTHIDTSSDSSLESTYPTQTQATNSFETTTDHITTHADTQISGLDTTVDAESQRTSTTTLTMPPSLPTSAVKTTEQEIPMTMMTTGDGGDRITPSGSTTDGNVVTTRLETSMSFSPTNASSTTTEGRAASPDRAVLIVLLSTAAVIVFSIACLIIVGCCIARKWRERNSYPDDDQTLLRSPRTYSQQSNKGRKYMYGQEHPENKQSFAHRLMPFQPTTKVKQESDFTDASSLPSPSPTSLSIINDYFEQMHGVHNDGLEHGGIRNHRVSFTELHDEGTDPGSESFEMRFFPDTEYWKPSSSSDVADTPYYITDDAPLPVSHV